MPAPDVSLDPVGIAELLACSETTRMSSWKLRWIVEGVPCAQQDLFFSQWCKLLFILKPSKTVLWRSGAAAPHYLHKQGLATSGDRGCIHQGPGIGSIQLYQSSHPPSH
jgi:hypothetical protein